MEQILETYYNILETKGVGIIEYKNTIDKIVDYIKNKKIPNDIDYVFYIPKELLSEIDFIYNINIEIKVIKYDKESFSKSTGKIDFNSNSTKLFNGLITGSKITINIEQKDGKLLYDELNNTLYHEFNHLFECYNILKHTGNVNNHIKNVIKSNISSSNKNVFEDKSVNNNFKYLIYLFLSKTELNAIIAGTYGELLDMNCDSNHNKDYLEKTYAYKLYKLSSNVLNNILMNMNLDNHEKIISLLNEYNIHDYDKYSLDEFKKRFKIDIEKGFRRLLNGIGKVAILYKDIQSTTISTVNSMKLNEMMKKSLNFF